MMEVSPHRATDDLGVPEVNGTWECNGCGYRKSGGSAQNCADVTRVLYGVENEEAPKPLLCHVFQRVRGDASDGENSLWRFRLGGARKVRVAHAEHLYAPRFERLHQCYATRGGLELRRGERSLDRQRVAKELLHGAQALADEEVLALSRFSPPQVAS